MDTKGKLFWHKALLILLFLICLLGTLFGAAVYGGAVPRGILWSFAPSWSTVFFRCLVCYGLILMFARFPLGLAVVPGIVFLRGMLLGISVFVQCSMSGFGILDLLPVFVELCALFYLSAVSMVCAYRKLRGRTIGKDEIKLIGNGVLCGILCAVISGAISMGNN